MSSCTCTERAAVIYMTCTGHCRENTTPMCGESKILASETRRHASCYWRANENGSAGCPRNKNKRRLKCWTPRSSKRDYMYMPKYELEYKLTSLFWSDFWNVNDRHIQIANRSKTTGFESLGMGLNAAGNSEGNFPASPRPTVIWSTKGVAVHSDASVEAYTVDYMLWGSIARLDFDVKKNYLYSLL